MHNDSVYDLYGIFFVRLLFFMPFVFCLLCIPELLKMRKKIGKSVAFYKNKTG